MRIQLTAAKRFVWCETRSVVSVVDGKRLTHEELSVCLSGKTYILGSLSLISYHKWLFLIHWQGLVVWSVLNERNLWISDVISVVSVQRSITARSDVTVSSYIERATSRRAFACSYAANIIFHEITSIETRSGFRCWFLSDLVITRRSITISPATASIRLRELAYVGNFRKVATPTSRYIDSGLHVTTRTLWTRPRKNCCREELYFAQCRCMEGDMRFLRMMQIARP